MQYDRLSQQQVNFLLNNGILPFFVKYGTPAKMFLIDSCHIFAQPQIFEAEASFKLKV